MRERITYANVMSTVAAFLALAGGSTAVALSGKNSVKKDDIAKNAIRAKHIAGGAVAAGEVKDEALTGADIGPGAIGASEILDGSVGALELGAGSVGSSELGARVVGTSQQAAVPVARVERTADLSASNNAATPVIFDSDSSTDAFDPFDMWSPAAPGDVVVPVDGVYLAIVEVAWTADDTAAPGGPGDTGSRRAQVSAPGIGVFGINWIDARTFGAGFTDQHASGIANLSAGDAINALIVQANEDASTVDADRVTLQVIWLGPGV